MENNLKRKRNGCEQGSTISITSPLSKRKDDNKLLAKEFFSFL